jgi:hypothetical protein
MLELKPVVDFKPISALSHVVLVVGHGRAGDILTAYKKETGEDAVLLQITVNTTQEAIDRIHLIGEPYVLFVSKTPCTTVQELRDKLRMEGYLSTLPECVGMAYRVYDTLDLYTLAA